ncbi:hypothetical protein NW762_011709 [Fusarium torreyae]|uniref:Phosphoribulokinase/uridine kinase domain-containing protein n=1 Tax=Fusarium torreyae TaxID=1237075 RepID=A0A9W8RQX2_9HYPO|nr:hypothetical protein NW762_011709 [Fusarium torreyae]
MTADKYHFNDNAATLDRLVARVIRKYQACPADKRILISISGVPGSGKSTLAKALMERLRESIPKTDSVSMVPMDGYHLYRSQLAAMPNAAEAIHRRGAAFTFDAERFLKLVQSLSEPITSTTPTIYAPSFDHAVKDPVENDIAIPVEARIVIFEGLYLSLNREPWSSAARLMDELWFLDVDRDIGRARLVKRHVASGIVPDLAAAEDRVTTTDMLNADDILDNRLPVDELIRF